MTKSFWPWLICLVLVAANIVVWFGFARANRATQASSGNQTQAIDESNLLTQDRPQPLATTSGKPTVFVPILMYHYIRDYTDTTDPLGINLSVSPATFKKQLETLKAAGYQTISLNNFAVKKYGSKPVILTFDDGYDDHYTAALPVLQQENMTGTFFIVRNFVGTKGYMTRTQIQSLEQAGMEVGAHTIDHKNLATMEYEAAVNDISLSLAGTDNVFAYPSGKYNATTLDIVSGLKIAASVTTNEGVATDKSSLYELPRVRVKEGTDIIKDISEQTALAKKGN
ncbi:MAG TPA: polysaccharide deacetylase family protein [Candidatus Saccharimonadales bacterium]|nr:polysaccharide deacetylase family protein [Candidatus Saccharimonadales bacterium]